MFPKDWVLLPWMVALMVGGAAQTGCARAIPKPDTDATGKPVADSSENSGPATPEALIRRLESRIEALEAKISMLNEKFDVVAMRQDPPGIERPTIVPAAKPQAALPHPADTLGAQVEAQPSAMDPEKGFAQGEAITVYRQAMVNFRSSRYPEAILGFSRFVEKYPDHPLAGSAQYHVGECYFRKKEWGVAAQEFQRVLTSFDRSSHVPDALRQLSLAEEKLNRPQDAIRHRQMLLSLYPQSPAAAGMAERARESVAVPVPAAASAVPVAPIAPEAKARRQAAVPPDVQQFDAPPPTLPVNSEE